MVWLRILRLAAIVSASSALSALEVPAQQPPAAPPKLPQQGTPPQQPTPTPPRRRALEIHGQAPAPEVVTVRPREIPQYTRKVVTPLLAGGSKPNKSTTLVVLNAPLPELRAQPNQSQRPE